MKRYLLAHDLGTSGNKATLFTVEGKLVRSVTSPYDTRYFNNNWAEQDPEDWWRAVVESSRRIAQGLDPGEVAAICFSGQMMGCLCVDREGRPLRPHILYCDQRAARECERLLERIEAREFYRITGHRASASYSLDQADVGEGARAGGVRPHLPHAARQGLAQLPAHRGDGHRVLRRLRDERPGPGGPPLVGADRGRVRHRRGEAAASCWPPPTWSAS